VLGAPLSAFLTRYGFGLACTYFLVHDGNRYDSKAIAGVAHRFVSPEKGALTADAFSGREATVAAKLDELGFMVVDERDGDNSSTLNVEHQEVWNIVVLNRWRRIRHPASMLKQNERVSATHSNEPGGAIVVGSSRAVKSI
jgi:hypothetical protein